jgi:hypothetical protein
MYPRISCELAVDSGGSAKQTLRTAVLCSMSANSCSHIYNFLRDNQNRFKCSLLQIVPRLKKCTCALVHLNTGTPSGPDDINSIVQFCPCTGQHYFHHTSDLLRLSWHEVLQCHPQAFWKQNTSYPRPGRNVTPWYQGRVGAKRLVHTWC